MMERERSFEDSGAGLGHGKRTWGRARERGAPEAGRRMGAVSDGKSSSSPPPEAQLRGV